MTPSHFPQRNRAMIRTLALSALAVSTALAAPASLAAQPDTGSGTIALPANPIPPGANQMPGSPAPGSPVPDTPPSTDPLPGNPVPGSPAPGSPLPADPGPGTPMPEAPAPAAPGPLALPPPPPPADAMNKTYPPCSAAVQDSCIQTARSHRPRRR